MHSSRLETFLARLFTDAEFREAFINDAHQLAEAQSLDAAELDAVLAIDRPGLLLAAHCFAAKRRDTGTRGSSRRLRPWWRQLIRRMAPRSAVEVNTDTLAGSITSLAHTPYVVGSGGKIDPSDDLRVVRKYLPKPPSPSKDQ
jgi:hypothetical protein